MARIISKRAKPAPSSAPSTEPEVFEIRIYSGTGPDYCLSDEDLEQIRRVFEGIRKSLDEIGS